MFPNQIPGFLPSVGGPTFNPGIQPPTANAHQPSPRVMPGVQINDIYQAAKNREVEDHELDKLFNPEFYGDAT